MKTRVIRYWGGTDWLYAVDKWEAREKDEELFGWNKATGFYGLSRVLRAGEFCWRREMGELSEIMAMRVARALSQGAAPPTDDVVVEYPEPNPLDRIGG